MFLRLLRFVTFWFQDDADADESKIEAVEREQFRRVTPDVQWDFRSAREVAMDAALEKLISLRSLADDSNSAPVVETYEWSISK